jgi:hypothetical protein
MTPISTQMIAEKIPHYVAPFLWSYDIEKIDLERDKNRIVINVLNLGTKGATEWLFSKYSKEEIKNIVSSSLSGEWNKKSLHYWRLILDITTPLKTARFS